MAQRRITQRDDSETVAAIDVEFDDTSKIQADIEAEESEFEQAFGVDTDDVKFHADLHRVREGSSQRPFLRKIARNELPNIQTKILQWYGTGDYEIRIRKEINGKKMLHRRLTFSVEAPIGIAVTQTPQQIESPAVLQAIQNQQQVLLSLLEKSNQQPAQSQRMSATEIAAIITAAATVLPALKSFMQSPAPAAQNNPFEMLQGVLEIVKDANSDGKEKGAFDLLDSLIKSPLFEKLAEGFQAPQQARIVTPALPDPSAVQRQQLQRQQIQPQMPQPAPAPAPMPTEGPANPVPDALRMQLDFLISRAQKDSDPELYAELLLDQDELHPFIPLLTGPAALPTLTQLEPRIGQHVDWFAELLLALTNLVNEARQAHASENAPGLDVSGLHPAPVYHHENAGGEAGSLDDP